MPSFFLRTVLQTHLSHRSCHLLKQFFKSSFMSLVVLARLSLMSWMDSKHVTFVVILTLGNSPKLHGTRFSEPCGQGHTALFLQVCLSMLSSSSHCHFQSPLGETPMKEYLHNCFSKVTVGHSDLKQGWIFWGRFMAMSFTAINLFRHTLYFLRSLCIVRRTNTCILPFFCISSQEV